MPRNHYTRNKNQFIPSAVVRICLNCDGVTEKLLCPVCGRATLKPEWARPVQNIHEHATRGEVYEVAAI